MKNPLAAEAVRLKAAFDGLADPAALENETREGLIERLQQAVRIGRMLIASNEGAAMVLTHMHESMVKEAADDRLAQIPPEGRA